MITRQEFERHCADKNGCTVLDLRKAGHYSAPCYCEYEKCLGWQSLPSWSCVVSAMWPLGEDIAWKDIRRFGELAPAGTLSGLRV